MAVEKTGTPSSSSQVSAATLTFSYTVAADADALGVGVSLSDPNGNVGTVTSVTYNGVAMTEVTSDVDTGGAFERAYVFQLVAPATGAHDVVISTTGAVSGIIGGAQGFKGVDQSTPISNSQPNHGNDTTPTVTVTSASGEWTMAAVASGTPDLASPTQTQLWLVVLGTAVNGGGSDATGAASVTHAWTQSSDVWAMAAMSFKAASAGAAAPQFMVAATQLTDSGGMVGRVYV